MSATQEIRPAKAHAPRETGPMDVAEVMNLPASVDLVTSGRALGLGRSTTFALARSGDYPIPILRVGRKRVCLKSAICAHLGIPLTP